MAKPMSEAARKAWLRLEHVGPETVRDLERLGIERLEDLAHREPRELYDSLCKHTGERQDPCVLDVFSMLVSRAKGNPARPWWEFSRQRIAEESPDRRPAKIRPKPAI